MDLLLENTAFSAYEVVYLALYKCKFKVLVEILQLCNVVYIEAAREVYGILFVETGQIANVPG